MALNYSFHNFTPAIIWKVACYRDDIGDQMAIKFKVGEPRLGMPSWSSIADTCYSMMSLATIFPTDH